MAPWVEVPATKLDKLSLIPATHVVEEPSPASCPLNSTYASPQLCRQLKPENSKFKACLASEKIKANLDNLKKQRLKLKIQNR